MAVNPIKLVNVFSKTTLKSGTTIEKAIARNTCPHVNFFARGSYVSARPGVTKLITYAPESKMAKLGLDQVAISKMPDGNKYYDYFSNGKHIQSLAVDSNEKVFGAMEGGGRSWVGGSGRGTVKDYLKPIIDTLKLFH